jgi:hypothetical protein
MLEVECFILKLSGNNHWYLFTSINTGKILCRTTLMNALRVRTDKLSCSPEVALYVAVFDVCFAACIYVLTRNAR